MIKSRLELWELPAVIEQTFHVENRTYETELPKTGLMRKLGPSLLLAMSDKVFPEKTWSAMAPTCTGSLSCLTPSRIPPRLTCQTLACGQSSLPIPRLVGWTLLTWPPSLPAAVDPPHLSEPVLDSQQFSQRQSRRR